MKRVNTSQITFNDIRKTFAFTKVIWNGEVAWDDGYCNGDYDMFGITKSWLKKHTGVEGLKYFEEKYGPKKIYSFYARVVDFHHFELYIEGE